jgi:hypothetical protein
MYPQYAVDPSTGGFMRFRNPRDFKAQESSSSFDWQKAKDECTKANPGADSTLINACIKSKKEAAEGSTKSEYDGRVDALNAQYSGQQQKGGFVYADTLFPFIL